jgi:hypothetical protein
MTIYQNLIAGSGFLQGPTGATGPAANTNITIYEYVATAGQTTFNGTDNNSRSLTYTPTGIFVTLNGSVLNDVTDFTATNGTSVVLTQAAVAGDELNIYAFPAFNVANTYTQAQANTVFLDRTTANTTFNTKLNISGGQLTGNVSFANGANLLVPVGNTAQRPAAAQGYIRYNTDLNTLESANATAWANVGSGSASAGGGGVTWQPVQNTNFIAVTGSGYLVNTYSSTVTATLPASPTAGDNITFVDYGGYMSANSLILFPNGNKILGNTANSTLTSNTASVSLVYTDANKGWVPYNGFTSSPIGSYFVEALLIAGGGGAWYTGGGGAGGMLSSSTVTVVPGTPYTIAVGGGGGDSTSGTPSTFAGLTAIGGGGGHVDNLPNSGGSGAGSIRSNRPGGSGTIGQGYPGGGPGADGLSSYTSGSGGGGAGGAGFAPSGTTGGQGGTGLQSSFTGTTTYYAGGGSGGGDTTVQSIPGTNGGGGAGAGQGGAGSPGTAGLGGGGGGAQTSRGNGGSGRIMIRYLGGQRATGGAITQTNGYTIHTFTSSGNFVA